MIPRLRLCSGWHGPPGAGWMVAAADPIEGRCWHQARFLIRMTKGDGTAGCSWHAVKLARSLVEGWQTSPHIPLEGWEPIPEPERYEGPPLDPFSVAEEAAAEMAKQGLFPSLAEFRAGRGWWDGEEPAPAAVGVLRVGLTDSEVLALAAEVERLRETLRELTTCDFIGDVQEKLHTLEPWLFEGDGKPQVVGKRIEDHPCYAAASRFVERLESGQATEQERELYEALIGLVS